MVYGKGTFREPYLYGQNYNPMWEALLAAPLEVIPLLGKEQHRTARGSTRRNTGLLFHTRPINSAMIENVILAF